MSNSKLISYTKLSPNYGTTVNGVFHPEKLHKIDKITPHHMAGNLSLECCLGMFAQKSKATSCNYAIDSQGRIGLGLDESKRSWCSSSPENDNRAITIEVANDGGAPDWHISDKALESLINLCVDICQRNNIPKLNFTGDKNGNLTMHKYFKATGCPGPYLASKFPYIASEVNKRLKKTTPETNNAPTNNAKILYRVQVGAFRNLQGAKDYEKKVNNLINKFGFSTYLVESGGLYKIQVGAFGVRKNAVNQMVKLKSVGLNCFITTQQGKPVK